MEKILNHKNLNIVIGLILLSVFTVFIISLKERSKAAIENYNETTIAYTKNLVFYEDSKKIKFYFYYNQKPIFNNQTLKKEDQTDIEYRYFLVSFDPKNPKNCHINLKTNLHPDSLTLVKAGFKCKKYYEHDISTNTYIKQYKWQ